MTIDLWVIIGTTLIVLPVWLPAVIKLITSAVVGGMKIGESEGHIACFNLIENEKRRNKEFRSVCERDEALVELFKSRNRSE